MLRKRAQDIQLKRDVLERPDYIAADVHALRAVYGGTATENQQTRAITYIVTILCGVHDVAYRSSDRDTAFALGKQKVGQDILWLLNTAMTKDKGEKQADEHGRE